MFFLLVGGIIIHTQLSHVHHCYRYVMLAASSSFKGKSDREKYSKAMRLKGCIGKIRADYKKNLTSKDSFNRQLATAMCVESMLVEMRLLIIIWRKGRKKHSSLRALNFTSRL